MCEYDCECERDIGKTAPPSVLALDGAFAGRGVGGVSIAIGTGCTDKSVDVCAAGECDNWEEVGIGTDAMGASIGDTSGEGESAVPVVASGGEEGTAGCGEALPGDARCEAGEEITTGAGDDGAPGEEMATGGTGARPGDEDVLLGDAGTPGDGQGDAGVGPCPGAGDGAAGEVRLGAPGGLPCTGTPPCAACAFFLPFFRSLPKFFKFKNLCM